MEYEERFSYSVFLVKEEGKMKKKEKKKYGIISNILYLCKELFAYQKSTRLTFPLGIIVTVLFNLVTVALPSVAVYVIENELGIYKFLMYVGGVVAAYAVLNVLNLLINQDYTQSCMITRAYEFIGKMVKKSLTTDYINRESNDNQKVIGKANNAISSNWVGVERVLREVPNVINNFIGLILYGGAIFLVDFKIIIVLILMLIFNVLTNKYARKYMNNIMEENTEIHRKRGYLVSKTSDITCGKDTRMYHMEKWFGDLLSLYVKKGNEWQKRIEKRWYLPVASDTIFIALRDGLAYIILIRMALSGEISLAVFTLMLGVVSGFSNWMFGLVSSCTELINANERVKDFRTVLDMKDSFKHGTGKGVEGFLDVPPEIEFKDVTFKYSEDGEEILSRINLHIKQGEKIALVGSNGAGKTTLVKLLCGFYHTSEGEILVNGISIEDYNIDEYFKLIGAVFQDIDVLPFNIVNIVSGKEKKDTDMDRFWDAVKEADIIDKIKELENGEDTYIKPIFDEKGIQLSGGETQKLMLARCIYKGAPFMILDEPTSALDPIAESKMYEEYNKLTNNKTSIFISHRLASTRFCDRILFLENGKIIEEGTHDELLMKNGRYAKIYNIQSHYYKKEKSDIKDMEAAYE